MVDSAPVRAALARRNGRLLAAHSVLSEARTAAESRGDAVSWAKVTLLRAEVLCALGDCHAADADMVSVVEQLRVPSAEVLGLLARARAVRASRDGDRRRFVTECRRAGRVFNASGDRFNARQTVALQETLENGQWPVGGQLSTRKHRLHFELAESLAFVCGLLPQPHLAAAEVVRLLKRMRVIDDAQVIQRPTAFPEADCEVALGTVGTDTFVLSVHSLQDPTSRETVAHILRVLRLAAAAVRADAEAKRQVLSWET